MDGNKLKIGQFSRLCSVTVKTLRHYAKIGLLVPQIIDRETGYRYYAVSQFQKMSNILRLKDMGYSLEEIKELYEDDNHSPSSDSLREKLEKCEQDLKRLQLRLSLIKSVLDAQKKIETMEKIEIEKLPAITVASCRRTIASYDELGQLCTDVIAPEMARLGCECTQPGYCFTVEHGGYRPSDIDIEYCEQVTKVPAGEGKDSSVIRFKELSEVPVAVCMAVCGPYEKLRQSYIDLFGWMDREGYRVAGQPRACYVDGIWNQENPEKWLTIIQVPAEKV